jgi:hypothetical protein
MCPSIDSKKILGFEGNSVSFCVDQISWIWVTHWTYALEVWLVGWNNQFVA